MQLKNRQRRRSNGRGEKDMADRNSARQKRREPEQPACEKTGYFHQEQGKHRRCAKQRKLRTIPHEHQPAHEHVKQKRRVAVINTETVQAGIWIKTLCIGGKDGEYQKWDKDKKSGCSIPRVKLSQHSEHQRRCDDQYGPLNEQQRLRFRKQGLPPCKKIIAKGADRCGEVHIGNLARPYALGRIEIDVAVPVHRADRDIEPE